MTREERLARTFVELADTLVGDFDVVELMGLLVERSVELLDASAAGLLLADNQGALKLMASTSEATELVELFQVQNDEGPCLDCYRSGEPVIADDLAAAPDRWPRFARYAAEAGFSSAHALPLRLRGEVLGALNLFRAESGALGHADVAIGQALADVATIAVLQFRAVHEAHTLAEQLEEALRTRIVIEQAKGVLAERAEVGMEEAFLRLRRYARSHQRLLVDVAEEVVNGTLSGAIVEQRGARRDPAGTTNPP
jgi:GAF domain-containing protein